MEKKKHRECRGDVATHLFVSEGLSVTQFYISVLQIGRDNVKNILEGNALTSNWLKRLPVDENKKKGGEFARTFTFACPG